MRMWRFQMNHWIENIKYGIMFLCVCVSGKALCVSVKRYKISLYGNMCVLSVWTQFMWFYTISYANLYTRYWNLIYQHEIYGLTTLRQPYSLPTSYPREFAPSQSASKHSYHLLKSISMNFQRILKAKKQTPVWIPTKWHTHTQHSVKPLLFTSISFIISIMYINVYGLLAWHLWG